MHEAVHNEVELQTMHNGVNPPPTVSAPSGEGLTGLVGTPREYLYRSFFFSKGAHDVPEKD